MMMTFGVLPRAGAGGVAALAAIQTLNRAATNPARADKRLLVVEGLGIRKNAGRWLRGMVRYGREDRNV
jgi:hypothetical protein